MSITEQHYQCPCCDYFTLNDRAGFLICPVCYWEDDGQDLDRADEVSGPNHITLRQARTNFESFGACDQAAVSLVKPPGALRREIRTV